MCIEEYASICMKTVTAGIVVKPVRGECFFRLIVGQTEVFVRLQQNIESILTGNENKPKRDLRADRNPN